MIRPREVSLTDGGTPVSSENRVRANPSGSQMTRSWLVLQNRRKSTTYHGTAERVVAPGSILMVNYLGASKHQSTRHPEARGLLAA